VAVEYELSAATLEHLGRRGLAAEDLEPLRGTRIASAEAFLYQVRKYLALDIKQEQLVLGAAEVVDIDISVEALTTLDGTFLGTARADAVRDLAGHQFDRRWKLEEALTQGSEAWRPREALPINELYNKARRQQLDYIFEHFRTSTQD
jgi:hypothetical protein